MVHSRKAESASQIIPNLYLGDSESSIDLEWLQSKNIIAIVNCAAGQCPCKYPTQFKYLALDLLDSNDQNLFPYFDRTVKFISDHIEIGSVLVHCQAGVSRSAAMVSAYLIKERELEQVTAYKLIRSARSVAHPNFGFQKQLKRYDTLQSLPVTAFLCKKCRKVIFLNTQLVEHQAGQGYPEKTKRILPSIINKDPKRAQEMAENQSSKKTKPACTSWFTQKLGWIGEKSNKNQGKLHCPHCSKRIGSFTWSGQRCSCGTWVNPSFQFPKSRLDSHLVKKKPSKKPPLQIYSDSSCDSFDGVLNSMSENNHSQSDFLSELGSSSLSPKSNSTTFSSSSISTSSSTTTAALFDNFSSTDELLHDHLSLSSISQKSLSPKNLSPRVSPLSSPKSQNIGSTSKNSLSRTNHPLSHSETNFLTYAHSPKSTHSLNPEIH